MCQIYNKGCVLSIDTEVRVVLAGAAGDLSLNCRVDFVKEYQTVSFAFNSVDGLVAAEVVLDFVVLHL